MKIVKAFLNHGRWLARCPIHRGGVADVDHNKKEFICPVCYPQSIAVLIVKREGMVTAVPDRSARKTAEVNAKNNDNVYAVEFPEPFDEFMERFTDSQITEINWTPED